METTAIKISIEKRLILDDVVTMSQEISVEEFYVEEITPPEMMEKLIEVFKKIKDIKFSFLERTQDEI